MFYLPQVQFKECITSQASKASSHLCWMHEVAKKYDQTFYLTGSRENNWLVIYLSLTHFLEVGVEGLGAWRRLQPMDKTLLDIVKFFRLP